MKKTKIVCTLGPASSTKEVISKMYDAGMNVCRINFSHGTHQEHAEKIKIIKERKEKKKKNKKEKRGKKRKTPQNCKSPM